MEWLEKSEKFISALRYYYPDVNATQQDLESAFEKFFKGFPDLINKEHSVVELCCSANFISQINHAI